MLIDFLIVILVSILYYLICSLSRIINLFVGMLLIFLLCWAVGVNMIYDTSVAELSFLVIVGIINVWIAFQSHHLVNHASSSRMNEFHHHHNDHIYAVRNRLNHFRLNGIKDYFKATPEVYLRTLKHQIKQLNYYISKHSNYSHLNQLIKSLKVIRAEIDDINYHLDLPMQINFPHGLRRIICQYHQIVHNYQLEQRAVNRENIIVDVLSHGARNPNKLNIFLNVTLRFPYQRLVHDRMKHQLDLLVINTRGVFAFTLLNSVTNPLNINQNDEVISHDIYLRSNHHFRTVINLKNKLNLDFNSVNYLIPHQINIMPYVGVICTDPNVKINIANSEFKIIKPQQLNLLMMKLPPVLTPNQVHQITIIFRNCFTHRSKSKWYVFATDTKSVISQLLWYQNQVITLSHKLGLAHQSK